MKKSALLLLAILPTLALPACEDPNYIMCDQITMNGRTYYSTHQDYNYLVVQYRFTDKEDSYQHFFVSIKKESEAPAFPGGITIKYQSYDGSHGSRYTEFVKILGTYENFDRCYISKDLKKIKVDSYYWKPINAPYDEEAQGKDMYELRLNQYGTISPIYVTECFIYSVHSKEEHSVIDVEGDVEYVPFSNNKKD